jgi:hypothetical protein
MVGVAHSFSFFIRNRLQPIDDHCLQLAEPEGMDVLERDPEYAFRGLAEYVRKRLLDVLRAIHRQLTIKVTASGSIRVTDDRDVDCRPAERRQPIGTYDS